MTKYRIRMLFGAFFLIMMASMSSVVYGMLAENADPLSLSMGGSHVADIAQNGATQNPAALSYLSNKFGRFTFAKKITQSWDNLFPYKSAFIHHGILVDISDSVQYNPYAGKALSPYHLEPHTYASGSFNQIFAIAGSNISLYSNFGQGFGFYKKFFAYYGSQTGQRKVMKDNTESLEEVTDHIFYAKDSFGIPLSSYAGASFLSVSVGITPKLDFFLINAQHNQQLFVPQCNPICSVSSKGYGYNRGRMYGIPNADAGAIATIAFPPAFLISGGIHVRNIWDQSVQYYTLHVPIEPYVTVGEAIRFYGLEVTYDQDMNTWHAPYSNIGSFQQDEKINSWGMNFWDIFRFGYAVNTLTHDKSFSWGISAAGVLNLTVQAGDVSGYTLTTSIKVSSANFFPGDD